MSKKLDEVRATAKKQAAKLDEERPSLYEQRVEWYHADHAAKRAFQNRHRKPAEFIRDGSEKLIPTAWLVEDVLPVEGAGMTYGESDVGKTFTTLSMDVAIAAGIPWFGHTTKGGTVVYFAYEGGRAFALRKQAARVAAGISEKTKLSFVTVKEKFDSSLAERLRAYVEKNMLPPIRKVTLDTLSQHMTGDVDNNDEMQDFLWEFRGFCGKLSDGPVFGHVIHHPGHNNKNRARGAYALPADLDTRIKLHGTKDRLLFEVERQRDDDTIPPIPLKLELVDVTQNRKKILNDRGKPQKTLVARSREKVAADEMRAEGEDPAFIDAVLQALPQYPEKIGTRAERGVMAKVKASFGSASHGRVSAALVVLENAGHATNAPGRQKGSLVWGRSKGDAS